ncbi:MAG: hypothetical protein K8U57_20775 [Planctomycetes bacterium]|nr:hypothetical protein [Planctomycetota bacterium]
MRKASDMSVGGPAQPDSASRGPTEPDLHSHPEPTLQTTALRYAASDLTPGEATAFETRLADDQDARDALSEAVRLSAAALGQTPPTPHPTFQAVIRERLVGWCPDWLARRAYRGHPLAWCGLGAVIVAMCTIVGLSFAERAPSPAQSVSNPLTPTLPVSPQMLAVEVVAPMPRETDFVTVPISTPATCGESPTHSIAELWAQMSTPEHVEKTHDEEMRWRHKHPTATALHPVRTNSTEGIREP